MLDILNQPKNWDKLFTSEHARSIHRYSVTNPSISYFSIKNNKTMFLESHAEFNYALLLECDPDVVRFQSQPFSFNYAKNRRYTPDFIEDRVTHIALAEIKSEDKIIKNNELIKHSIIKDLCNANGAEFSVLFISHDNPAIKLQRRLYRFHAHDTVNLFKYKPTYVGSIKDLLNDLGDGCDAIQSLCSIYAGIFKGQIFIKSYEKLSHESIISWGQ